MAQLQVYDAPKVRENAVPGNRQSNAGSGAIAAAGNFAARQLEGVEQALSKVPDIVFKAADKKARADVLKPLNDFHTAARALRLSATSGEVDDEFEAKHSKVFDETAQKIGAQIKNPLARRYFDQKVKGEWKANYDSDINEIGFKGREKQRVAGESALLGSHVAGAIYGTTPAERASNLTEVYRLAATTNPNNPEARDKIVSETVAGMALKDAQDGDYAGAVKFLNENKDYVSPALFQKTEALLRKGEAEQYAYSKFRGADATPLAVALSDIDEKYTPGSPQHEAAKQGVTRAFAERRAVAADRVSTLTQKINEDIFKNGVENVDETTLEALANMPGGADSAAAIKRQKLAALENRTVDGTPYKKEVDAETLTTFSNVQDLIDAGEIATSNGLKPYAGFLTQNLYKQLDARIGLKQHVPAKQSREVFEKYLGDGAVKNKQKEWIAFNRAVQDEIRTNSTVNIDVFARTWAGNRVRVYGLYPGLDIDDSDMTFAEAAKRDVDTSARGDLGKKGAVRYLPSSDENAAVVASSGPALGRFVANLKAFTDSQPEKKALYEKVRNAVTRLGDLSTEDGQIEFYTSYGLDYDRWYISRAEIGLEGMPPHDGDTMAAFAVSRILGLDATIPTINKIRADIAKKD